MTNLRLSSKKLTDSPLFLITFEKSLWKFLKVIKHTRKVLHEPIFLVDSLLQILPKVDSLSLEKDTVKFLIFRSYRALKKQKRRITKYTNLEIKLCRRLDKYRRARKLLKSFQFSKFLKYTKYLFIENSKLYSIFSNISLRVRSNNVFCTLWQSIFNTNFKMITKSAGNFKLNISKKGYKSKVATVIRKFFGQIRPNLSAFSFEKFLTPSKRFYFFACVSIIVPAHIRYKFIRNLFKLLSRSKSQFLINICEKKVFNGCRAKKKRRKKRSGLRFLI